MGSEMNHLVDLIHCCSLEWRQVIERLAKQYKLTFSEWRAIVVITEGKGIEQQVLARKLNVAPNNIVNIADSLVKKGFITKKIKSEDKKIRLLQLTKKKEKQAKEISKLNQQINKSWFSAFSSKQCGAFEEALTQALSSIQSAHDKLFK